MPFASRAEEGFVRKLLLNKSIRISFLGHLFIYAAHDIRESIDCYLEMTFTDEDKDISLSLLIPSLACVSVAARDLQF